MENIISVVLPYWKRQAAAVAGLRSIATQEQGMALEVILVDDGDPNPFVLPDDLLFSVKVVRLQEKQASKSACVPINAGVSVSVGDVVVLSCPEMLHVMPVFAAMRARLNALGERGYVSAAIWAPESKVWHAHSSLKRPPLNFCTMLHRSLWLAAGGMDEDYREGYAFEDADFLNRLKKAGAVFSIEDALVVHHLRDGAKAAYSREQHERNRLLFESKWKA